jgi:hypothetical protein
MYRIALCFLLAGVLSACGNRESSGSSDADEKSYKVLTEDEYFPASFPKVELSYFSAKQDGSGWQGTERPKKIEQPPKGKVFTYEHFTIHAIPREGTGEDINVYQPGGGLAMVSGGEGVYFAGLHKQYLLLDLGAGASLRELMAVNLISGETTFRAAYHGDYAAMRGEYVVYLRPEENAESCTTDKGLSGKQHRMMWLNLTLGLAKAADQVECLYVE